ncbi:MAG: MBL fold metallo-hydrolase RNA specificity domain-containing protein [Bryobacteraceae bacterium]
MKLTFWGGAQTVTGSMHEVDVQGRRYLLDCGQYQGRRKEAETRNRHFPFPCNEIAAVLVSHAHIDHTGNLPLLVKNGFAGPIYASPATADLCHPMLLDSAHVQEQDALFINKRNRRGSHLHQEARLSPAPLEGSVQALYTTPDAERTFPLFHPAPLHTPFEVGPGLEYQSFEAGHMLGSTMMLLRLNEAGREVRVGFSGDLGRPGLPIIQDPEPLPQVDYLLLESTYGDRLHAPVQSVTARLAGIVNRTYNRGGKLIVPAFAVGRTQQLVLLLHELINAKQIPAFPIFVDSPLAVNITEVFRRHAELFDEETRAFVTGHEDPFGFKRLTYVRDVEMSKGLNDLRGPFMVIASSGMCEAGRILHHLKNNIEDPKNTVLLTGYQAENTLGRKIEQKQPVVPVFGLPMRLRAEVEKLDELSGHADQNELLLWMKPIAAGLKRVFLVHGEGDARGVLAKAIQERFGLEAIAPEWGQSFDL